MQVSSCLIFRKEQSIFKTTRDKEYANTSPPYYENSGNARGPTTTPCWLTQRQHVNAKEAVKHNSAPSVDYDKLMHQLTVPFVMKGLLIIMVAIK